MTTLLGIDEASDRYGRILAATMFGSWLTSGGADELAAGELWSGDWWGGVVLLLIGILVTLTLIPMLRSELRSPPGGTRRDRAVTTLLLLGAVSCVVRGFLSADSGSERMADLAVAPVWLVIAAVFVVARRQNERRAS